MVKMVKSRNISGKEGILKANTKRTKKNEEKEAESGAVTEFEKLRKRQKSEERRLRYIYKDLPHSQKILVSKILSRSAYVNSKLEEIETRLDEEGLVVDFENGTQIMQRVNPYLRAYMDLLKIYNALVEQIEDMLRHDRDHAKKENNEIDGENDPLIAFIKARR